MKDLFHSIAFEVIWTLVVIEFSGVLTLQILQPIFGDFILFLPAGIFALVLLVLLVWIYPRILSVILACVIMLLFFPVFAKIFESGFAVWEMAENGGWEVLLHVAFWLISAIIQIIAIVVGRAIRKYKK